MVQSPPLVSLQSPKDVSIDEIENELQQMWQSYNAGEEGLMASRAATFTFVVYEPEETQLFLSALGFYQGPVDGIAGPRTLAAVKVAQKAYNMKTTGKPDEHLRQKLREEYRKAKEGGSPTAENETAAFQYALDLEGSGIADAIAASNPCRIITLCPIMGEDAGVKAQVSAYCPIQKQNKSSLVCCEYITLTGTAEALERISGMVSALTIAELPKFLWWKATPEPEYSLFKRLVSDCDSVILDSSTFSAPEADLQRVQTFLQMETPVADLNWRRLASWQELTAEAFDPPERRSVLGEVDHVTIDYEKGNTAQAMMFLGWLGSRLNWRPITYAQEGGDYDIRRVKFIRDEDQREIEAELAAIPTADWGEIPGDLISLRLTSTNLDADCCTVLCSQTTGCMRMEAGGGAQSCRIQQVTPMFDQKTEQLLSKQLRRWGRDLLYEESMRVTAEILQKKGG
jgi:glucose-6-phosphate dehydrogenase assembly protein OpcA